MCSPKKSRINKPKRKMSSEINDQNAGEYFQLDSDNDTYIKEPIKSEKPSRVLEQCIFVFSMIGLMTVSQCITTAHWLTPFIYAIATPIFLVARTVLYWKYKWQYFMIDFCYFLNALTYILLWIPDNKMLFQIVFALANGPVLVAAVLYRNSLVLHHHDKMTSCYIHVLPATLTYCIRWYPTSTSTFWLGSFVEEAPSMSILWSYAVPFACFATHSVIYCLIVNVIFRPQKPYITSYCYLAEKFEKCNCIGGPWGQGIAYYGLGWLFCASSLLLSMAAYYSQPAHCALLAFMFIAILWNGASYYVHVFSKRGFNEID